MAIKFRALAEGLAHFFPWQLLLLPLPPPPAPSVTEAFARASRQMAEAWSQMASTGGSTRSSPRR